MDTGWQGGEKKHRNEFLKTTGAGEMAQQLMAPAIKPHDLSLTPETRVVGEN